jgi:hypothetical protein
MITQILNFGMPSPIDIEIEGANVSDNRVVANQILDEVRRVTGVVDARIQQRFDYPDFGSTSTAPYRCSSGSLSVDLRSSLEPSKAQAVLGKISAYNFGGCRVTP